MFAKVFLVLVTATVITSDKLPGGSEFSPTSQRGFQPQQQFQIRQEIDDEEDNLPNQGQRHFSGASQPQSQFNVPAQSQEEEDDNPINNSQQRFSEAAQPPQHFSRNAQPQFSVRNDDDEHNRIVIQTPQHFAGAAQSQQQLSSVVQPQQQFSGAAQPQQQFLVRAQDNDEDDRNIVFQAQQQLPGISQSVSQIPSRAQPQSQFAGQSQTHFSGPVQQSQQTFSASVQRQQMGQSQHFGQQQFRISSDDSDDSWEEGDIRAQPAPQSRVQTSPQIRAQPSPQIRAQLSPHIRTQPSPLLRQVKYSTEDLRAEEPAKYEFTYAVRDAQSVNEFGHSETRDADNTRGEYFVRLPDGRLQRVTYSVIGDSGFLAQVIYEGEARLIQNPLRSTQYPS